MRNFLRTGAVIALALVLAVALLGVAWSGLISNTADGTANGVPESATDPLPGGTGLTNQNGGQQASDATDYKVRLQFVSADVRVVGPIAHYVVQAYNPNDDTPYTGELILQVDVSPAGQVIGPTPGDTPGLYTFDLSLPYEGVFCATVTPYDLDCNLIGDPIEVAVTTGAEPDCGPGPGDGNGDGQPGNGTGDDNQTTEAVRLVLSSGITSTVMVGGDTLVLGFVAYNLDDNSTYADDIVLQVEITPSGAQVTDPAPDFGFPGVHYKLVVFNQPGNYTIKVTPYDGQGNLIGDPFERTVNAVPEGTLVLQNYGAHNNNVTNQTMFWLSLYLYSENRQQIPEVTRTVLTIDNNTYENVPGYQYARAPNAAVYVSLPSSEITPGAPYTLTAYNGDQVVATVSGNAPT